MFLPILLGSIILLVLYYLYLSLFSVPLIATVDLRKDNSDISSKDIPDALSLRSSFGVWVYSHQLKNNAVLFEYKTDAKTYFKLYFDTNTPTLKVDINVNNTIVVSDNFPMQRWTYVVVNIDNKFADVYIDGKLVKSTELKNPITNEPEGEPRIVFGKNSSVILNKLMRWSVPLDPQSVWNQYLQGAQDLKTTIFGSNYHFAVTVSKDAYRKDYNLF